MKREFWFWMGVICLFLMLHKFVVKESLIYQINQILPAREAGLLSGMVWGDKSGFSKSFYEKLQVTGLVHLVVASGTNVMIITRLVIENMAYLLSRKRAIVVGMGLVWWYAVVVGLDPPIVRAAGLMSVFYAAQLVGRKFDLTRALILIVAVMAAANWKVVMSVSFWLSMAAFVGVITGERFMINDLRFKNKKYSNPLISTFYQTVWISVWVTPILSLVFGQISLIGPVINVAVLFLAEWVTIIGWLGMAVKPLLWLAYPALFYITRLVEMVGSQRGMMVEVSFNWWLMVGWYMILGYFLVKKRNPSESGEFR